MTQASTVVTGASGRLGRAVLDRLGPDGLGAARTPTLPSSLEIGRDGFRDIGALVGVETLVNCAGLASGTRSDLAAANIALPETLAGQARDAGVAHFVQISSFAIFGRVEHIRVDRLAPVTDYGRSKAEAEQRLRALEDDGFRVTCLRLPFMFGPGDGSLLAPLARLMSKCRAMPVPRPLPQRSMITFVDAAHVVASVIAQPGDRDVNAADPLPFTFALLANAIAEQTSRRIRLIGLPGPAIALAGLAAPRLKHSLFATNLLDPAINLAANLDLPLGLRRGLAGLVAAQHA